MIKKCCKSCIYYFYCCCCSLEYENYFCEGYVKKEIEKKRSVKK